jgi:hypothetical protein
MLNVIASMYRSKFHLMCRPIRVLRVVLICFRQGMNNVQQSTTVKLATPRALKGGFNSPYFYALPKWERFCRNFPICFPSNAE